MVIPVLRERDFFADGVEMHYALVQSAEKIGPDLHTHEFFEIFLLIEGQIRHFINEQQVVLNDGSLTLIRPKDAHYYRPIPNRTCQIINLAITRSTLTGLFDYLGSGFPTQALLQQTLPPTITLAQVVKQQMIGKLAHLNGIPRTDSAEKQTALRILLFELITQFTAQLSTHNATGLPAWLHTACIQMQQPENLRLGIPKMLELAAVTPEHLARSMRKWLNLTPTAYVNQLRLSYAANLLTHSDRSILDIAAHVGFHSVSHFYRLFKQQFGQTPRQYRQQHFPQLLQATNIVV